MKSSAWRFSLAACVALIPMRSIAIQMSDANPLPLPTVANDYFEAQSAGVGDTNGDGRMDVVAFVTGIDGVVDQRILVYEQQADGTMPLVKQFTLRPGGTYAYSGRGGAVADLDGDGKAEFLVAGVGTNAGKLMILGRDAGGDYHPVAALDCPLATMQVYTRDLNADGRLDILLQDGARGYAIYFGQGALAFSKPMYVLGMQAGTALVADVDYDGVDDLVSADHLADSGLGVNFGLTKPELPAGGIYDFTEPKFFDWTPGSPASAAYGLFPGSDHPTLALWYEEREDPNADHPNSIMFYQKIRTVDFPDQQHYAVTATYAYQSGISRNTPPMEAADIDQDGDDDIIVFDGKHIEILLQQDGGFAPVYVVPDTTAVAGNYPTQATTSAIADFNGDGCDDIGYMEGKFMIHYRVDCPVRAHAVPSRSTLPHRGPTRPMPRIGTRLGKQGSR